MEHLKRHIVEQMCPYSQESSSHRLMQMPNVNTGQRERSDGCSEEEGSGCIDNFQSWSLGIIRTLKVRGGGEEGPLRQESTMTKS